MVEWSITAVLKTAVLRGTGGSNPSLSAIRILQDVDYQSCRIFLCQKKCTKNAPCIMLKVYSINIGRVYNMNLNSEIDKADFSLMNLR